MTSLDKTANSTGELPETTSEEEVESDRDLVSVRKEKHADESDSPRGGDIIWSVGGSPEATYALAARKIGVTLVLLVICIVLAITVAVTIAAAAGIGWSILWDSIRG